MVTTVDSLGRASALAAELLRGNRSKPAVVVSIAAGAKAPYVDVAELQKAVGDDCDIYVMPTGSVSFAFADGLPHGRQVYGGASRVYSTDNAWVTEPLRSPLRFAFGPDTHERVLNQLIQDAMAAAYAAGPSTAGQRSSSARKPVSGTVRGLVAGRALVDVGGVWPAVTYPDRLVPGVGAEHLFQEKQSVKGLLDTDTNVLHIESVRPFGEALENVGVETVLFARVNEVRARAVTVEIYPDVAIVVAGESPDDDLRTAFTLGEVVPVEVTGLGPDGIPNRVEVMPSSFEEFVVPVMVLEGGPPWLTPPLLDVPDDAHGSPALSESPRHAAESDDQEVQGLRDEVLHLQSRLEHLEQELQIARTRARESRQQARELNKALSQMKQQRTLVSPGLFSEEEEQFLHEVYVSWAERTTPSDKEQYPWHKPCLGPEFLSTLNQLHGVDHAKVVEVTADVVCGRADTIAAREVHQLREGAGGDDPPVTRAGGETCWRVSLQQKSPSARRLHFWRLTDGGVELSSVRLHDDFQP